MREIINGLAGEPVPPLELSPTWIKVVGIALFSMLPPAAMNPATLVAAAGI